MKDYVRVSEHSVACKQEDMAAPIDASFSVRSELEACAKNAVGGERKPLHQNVASQTSISVHYYNNSWQYEAL